MPEAPVLASHSRGGRILPTHLALRAEGAEASASWSPRSELSGFSLELEVESRPGSAEIRLAVRNLADRPRNLEAVLLGFEWMRTGAGASGVLHFDAVALAGDTEDGASALVGARSAHCLARATARPAAGGAQLEIELGVFAELAAGERRELDAVVVATGEDPNALLEDFGEGWGRAAGARVWRPAPLIWALEPAAADRGADALSDALDALAKRRSALPLEVLLLPPSAVRKVGDWTRAASGYPNGLESAAAQIRDAGLVPGLRLAPGLAASDSEVCRLHPDWFGDGGRADGLRSLDSTREGALEHLERDFQTLHEWGFFYFELEGLAADLEGAVSDPSRGPASRLQELLDAVRRGASDEAFLLAADGPPGPALGRVDARLVGGSDDAGRPAVLQAWMHRRLWLCASEAPEAGQAGAMLVAREDPAALTSEALSRWSGAAQRARSADEGVPGSARMASPFSASARLAVDPAACEPPSELAVFCDFDGTFSVQDVGATLAVRHGGERRPQQWARYERGEITPWDYNLEILDGLPVGTEALEEFLRSVDLDPGARQMLAWCDARRVPFRILSDGFDLNLNFLQALHGVRFAYTANHLRVEHGRWRIAAGAPDARCGCGTGTCKAGILRAYRENHPRAHLVHIGNGRVSDSCGAVEADTAFAKDSLAVSLASRGEPFVAFETLGDVLPHLDRILAASGPQVRRGSQTPAL